MRLFRLNLNFTEEFLNIFRKVPKILAKFHRNALEVYLNLVKMGLNFSFDHFLKIVFKILP